MSLSACDAKLNAITRELSSAWDQTAQAWRDRKRDDFERAYLANLYASVEAARRAIGELDKIIGVVRKDCE